MKINTLFTTTICGFALQASLFATAPTCVPFLDNEVSSQNELARVSHTTRQTRPIQLGTSGGSTVDLANGYCCSGTLGSLVKDSNGTLYILSNTHVFAGDSAAGGNGKISAKGDPINQPGYVDINCQNRTGDYVATLERWIPLVANGTSSVDAAIAKTSTNMVNSLGTILEIGTISSTPRTAFVGQRVKKSGRTSGLTTGQVAALNATITVQYPNECAGRTFTTTFKNQILVTPGRFLKSGDSGSLLVENIAKNPRPIGLLFAGSSTVAVANPIQKVLSALQVSMVGIATPAAKFTNFEKTTSDAFAQVARTQAKRGDMLLQMPGVCGHALGVSKNSSTTPVLLVLVAEATGDLLAQIPQQLDGIPVEILEVGNITAY